MSRADRKDFSRRLQRLARKIKKEKIDAMLVMTAEHRFYLTGFRSTMGLLIIEPDREPCLLVDARYHEMAREEVPEVRARRIEKIAIDLAKLAERRKWQRVGFEGTISTRELHQLQQAAVCAKEWIDAGSLIEELRIRKSRDEQQRLRRAARVGDKAWKKTIEAVRPGMTEWDIRKILRRHIDELNAEGESFDCIISAGNNSSKPHAHVTDRVLRTGQPLLIDMGVVLDGYCSDMTRTVFIRKASNKMHEIYDIVLEAQSAALQAIRTGVTCSEIDAVARDIIHNAGYGKQFTHGLGHGVGIEIHEAPTLRKGVDTPLKSGMVVSIEPGIYLPGIGGVRIEDVVIVRPDGHENLTRSPKELTVL